jgi:hypothetical protein
MYLYRLRISQQQHFTFDVPIGTYAVKYARLHAQILNLRTLLSIGLKPQTKGYRTGFLKDM